MIRSPAMKLAFVHIPRTGGSAVGRAIRASWTGIEMTHFASNAVWGEHQTAVDASMRYTDWSEYFSFAFVRNPWDRAVSLWSTMMPEISFEDWLRHRPGGPREHFSASQASYLFHPLTGRQLVSDIGRYETLAADFLRISTVWGATSPALETVNTTTHQPFEQYYTLELEQLVADRYGADIIRFGYSPPSAG